MATVGVVRTACIALAFVAISQVRLAAQLVPLTDEFQVNVVTMGGQFEPVVDSDAAGNFVVVWSGQDGDRSGIFGRRFDNSGTPVGTEFQVNTFTTYFQDQADIDVADDGSFVVVWTSLTLDGFDAAVAGQRFDAAATRLGTEFQVNTITFNNQQDPAVAIDTAGNFIVAFEHDYDGSYAGIFARRYDAGGVPQGTEFLVNTFTVNDQLDADIAWKGTDFIVVWSSFVGDLSAGAVYAQRLDTAGNKIGTEFLINTYTTGRQQEPSVGVDGDGNFVIAWSSNGQDGNGFGIFAQRYASDATPVGSEFPVNVGTTGNQTRPFVAVAEAGNFVISWQGPPTGDPLDEIWARSFSRDALGDGADLQLNQFTTSFQSFPTVTSIGDRDFVAMWSSPNQDGSNSGVYGRRIRQAGNPITAKKLFIRADAADPARNKLTFVSTDPGFETPTDVSADPRCPPVGSGSVSSGARLRVSGAGGNFTIDLPCVNWSANNAGTRFRYRDASGATCRSIVLRAGKLVKASCRGAQIAYALTAAQGDVSVTLETGDPASNEKHCATFGPETSTVLYDGSDGRRYSAINAGPGTCL